MTIQKLNRPEPEVNPQRVDPPKIRDVHTVIIEISLWKQTSNTLLTVHSSLYANPIQQYATFRNIHAAVRHYRGLYEQAGFSVSNIRIHHVHADMFTAEFFATH